MHRHRLPLLFVLLAIPRLAAAAPVEIACYGLRPAAGGLARSARELGYTLVAARGDATANLPATIAWEFSERHEITEDWARALGAHVRRGGRLLLGLSHHPGTGPLRLAFLAPTTGWHPFSGGENVRGAVRLAERDANFFAADPRGVELPYHFEIRPFHAVERGQGRYERFEQLAPYVRYSGPATHGEVLPPHRDWWTRPLENRDWQIRARGDDLAATPLLLTGRYGAGRVAVFAGSLETTADTPAGRAFWSGTLRWLLEPAAVVETGDPQLHLTPQTQLDAEQRLLRVTLANPAGRDLPVELVARLETWEQALVGDVIRTLTLPPHAQHVVEIPLPSPSDTGYAALAARDGYHVRLGLLSSAGQLLGETRIDADLRPATRLTLATGDVRSVPFPSPVPPPDLGHRMGLPAQAYAFQPGQSITVYATLAHGLRNVAPQAAVDDESTPDNRSVRALNDEAVYAEHGPEAFASDAYGCYISPEGTDCVLRFTLPQPTWLAAVTLLGAPDTFRNYHGHNPQAVTIEVDGRQVAQQADLQPRFLAEHGLVRIPFPAVQGKVVRLRMPAIRQPRKAALWLGEVFLEGGPARPEPIAGLLAVRLRNVATDAVQTLMSNRVSLAGLQETRVPIPLQLPAGDPLTFYRLEAVWQAGGRSERAWLPLLALRPERPLLLMSSLQPESAPNLGFIVTRGFRSAIELGTGTREELGGWGQPDDLVWAYERGLKQLGKRSPMQAGRLYVSENDLRHYSSCWKPFYNGEEFFDVAAPQLVARMQRDRRWKTSDVVCFGFSDRWDLGPSPGTMHSWQDYEGFNAYLLDQGQPGLTGRTKRELAAEIHDRYEGPWQAWHLKRYLHSMQTLRDAFAAQGKELRITSQGVNMLPGAAAAVVGQMERGMSDDCTWGMLRESLPLTTARQMAAVAFTPSLAMSTLCHWGYVSGALNNPQWHAAVATTEPSRRFLFDRAFRGMLRPDGTYHGMHVYGYNSNAGEAYTHTRDDLDVRQRVRDLHALLTPDGPLGAGVVLGTAFREQPDHLRFECGDALALPEAKDLAYGVWRLHDAGISVPFSTNASCLESWTGNAPLLLANLPQFTDREVAIVARLARRGVQLAAFAQGQKLSAAAAALFGVDAEGNPAGGTAVGRIAGRPIVVHERCLFFPLDFGNLSAGDAQTLAVRLREHLRLPLVFPPGTAGYGFSALGRTFVVVEDWREEGRTATLCYRPTEAARDVRVIDVNEHRRLPVRRANDAFQIEISLRPGDATLLAIEVER